MATARTLSTHLCDLRCCRAGVRPTEVGRSLELHLSASKMEVGRGGGGRKCAHEGCQHAAWLGAAAQQRRSPGPPRQAATLWRVRASCACRVHALATERTAHRRSRSGLTSSRQADQGRGLAAPAPPCSLARSVPGPHPGGGGARLEHRRRGWPHPPARARAEESLQHFSEAWLSSSTCS
jgi:hypothetical protein